jgi:hypothetical protein
MGTQPQPPVPRDQIVDGQGYLTRTWYRFFLSISGQSGQLSAPVIVPQNDILVPGTINSGDTLQFVEIPAATFLGNSTNTEAQPAPNAVGAGLAFSGGTLSAEVLDPFSLSGNPTNADAPPVSIVVGTGLSLDNTGTLTATGGGGGSGGFPLAAAVATWGP